MSRSRSASSRKSWPTSAASTPTAAAVKPATATPSRLRPAKALGLRLATPNDELIQRFGLDTDVTKGALVTSVDRNSPAAMAGITPGDIITQVGEREVTTAGEARDALAKEDIAKGIRLRSPTRQGSRFVLLRQDEK